MVQVNNDKPPKYRCEFCFRWYNSRSIANHCEQRCYDWGMKQDGVIVSDDLRELGLQGITRHNQWSY